MRSRQSTTRVSLSTVMLCACLGLLAGANAYGQGAVFPYGVASGDVTDFSAVIWTYSAALGPPSVQVSETADFFTLTELDVAPRRVLPGGATAESSWVFVVTGLAANRTYFYRFVAIPNGAAAVTSPIGRFRTLPLPDEPAALRFAFSGDSNFAYAPFSLLRSVAEEDTAFFVWFGDTIYADVPASGLGRAQTLDEYRAKYRQLRGDSNVQMLSAALPTIVGWDDHEIENDYAGADPDLPSAQRAAAYQAFFEFMPIADAGVETEPFRTYRSFRVGINVEFFLLDGRQYREPSSRETCNSHPDPTGYVAGAILNDPVCAAQLSAPRTMLGAEQLQWLLGGLRASTAKVKFVITSVPLQFLGIFPYDRWDGYDFERRTILEFIANHAIDGVFFMTTDLHGNFYNPDVLNYFRRYRPDYALAPGCVVPELITGPIGQATFQDTLDELRGGIEARVPLPAAHELLDVLESTVYRQLRKVSGVTFVEPNRLSYALIDVSADGEVHLTLKGLSPELNAAVEAPRAATFFDTEVEPRADATGVMPCCVFPVALSLLGVVLWGAGWPNREAART